MKCPHCNTGINETFSGVEIVEYPSVRTEESTEAANRVIWSALHMRCPECYEAIILLRKSFPDYGGVSNVNQVYPTGKIRPVPAEVVDPYKQDFTEACKVLTDSPKASAALSRRCLQAILRDKAVTKSKDLYDQIEEVIQSGKLPSHIAEDLHASGKLETLPRTL